MGKEAQKAAGYLMAAAFALTIIIFVFSSASLLRGQEFRENMLEAGVQVAGALFVVTVFVERLAVVASLIWGEARGLPSSGCSKRRTLTRWWMPSRRSRGC